MTDEVPISSKLNVEIFGNKKFKELNDYFLSTRYFFDAKWLPSSFSMLDIGGGSGLFIESIRHAGFDVKGTVIDPDPLCIEEGRQLYKKNDYIEDYFPSQNQEISDNAFDLVSIQALFPMIPQWKECVTEMCRVAKRFVNLSQTLKLDGTTVVDKDLSYLYYLDTGVRVHQVIHNIYEFVNYLCISALKVKKINFFGYHTPYSGHNHRCVPNSKQIKGNLLLELFSPDEEYPKRMGGARDKGAKVSGYEFFRPTININIDDKKFDIFSS